MALLSKISRLPRKVRDELNMRLDNGQLGPQILPWLNALPEVKKILDEHYQGAEINSQNLSTWRETGFCDWQRRQEDVQKTRDLTEFALTLADKSGALMKGNRALIGGKLLGVFEQMPTETLESLMADKPETLLELISTVAALSTAETSDQRVHNDRERLKLEKEKGQRADKKLALDREKFEKAVAEKIIEAARSPELQAILKGPLDNRAKIKVVRAKMFGNRTETKN